MSSVVVARALVGCSVAGSNTGVCVCVCVCVCLWLSLFVVDVFVVY